MGAKTYKKGGWLVIWSNEHLGTYKSHNITSTWLIHVFLIFFQTSLHHLSQHKTDLFHINVEIHNFLAELSCCPAVVFHTPPSSLGRKQQQQPQHQQQRLPQLMMTGEAVNLMTSEVVDPWFPINAKKESSIVKGLKEKVVALYSNYDEAFHK